jgi:ABC-type transporter Mla MlaB component
MGSELTAGSGRFPRSLLISVDPRAGRVRIAGELDRSCAHHLLDALAALELAPHPVWQVDATRLTFCDVAGVRTLAGAAAWSAGRGRTLHVVGAPSFLVHLLDLAGLAHLVAPDGARSRDVSGPRRPGSSRPCGSPS